MGTIDIIILVVIIAAAVYGAYRGLVKQAGTIAAVILAVLVCRFCGSSVADSIVGHGGEYAGLWRVLVYVLLFVLVFVGIRLLASFFAKTLSKMHVRAIDRVAGALFSAGLWLLVMSVVVNVYLAIVPSGRSHFSTPDRPWRIAVARMAPVILGYISTDDAK